MSKGLKVIHYFEAEKLQSAPGADNPRYVAEKDRRGFFDERRSDQQEEKEQLYE